MKQLSRSSFIQQVLALKYAQSIISFLVLTLYCLTRIINVAFNYSPRFHLYSDAISYVDLAIKFSENTLQGRYELIWPPGTSLILGLTLLFDPSLVLAELVWIFFSIAPGIIVYYLASKIYSKWIGILAVLILTLDISYLSQFSMFLSEPVFSFFICCSALHFGFLFNDSSVKKTYFQLFVFGLLVSICCSIRSSAIPAAFIFVIVIYRLSGSRCSGFGRRVFSVASYLLGFIIIAFPISHRCTTINDGTFCLNSLNAPFALVTAYGGPYKAFKFLDGTWRPPSRSMKMEYLPERSIGVSYYDDVKLYDWVFAEIVNNPFRSAKTVVSNTLDLFHGIVWNHTPFSEGTFKLLDLLFVLCIYLPILLYIAYSMCCYLTRRTPLVKGMSRQGMKSFSEGRLLFLYCSVMVISMLIVHALVLGEIRYRTPFDPLAILLFCGIIAYATRVEIASGKRTLLRFFSLLVVSPFLFAIFIFGEIRFPQKDSLRLALKNYNPMIYSRPMHTIKMTHSATHLEGVQWPFCLAACDTVRLNSITSASKVSYSFVSPRVIYFRLTANCSGSTFTQYIRAEANIPVNGEMNFHSEYLPCEYVDFAPLFGDRDIQISDVTFSLK